MSTWPVVQAVLFVGGSVPLLYLSRKPLLAPGAHGFYRFFAWECMLVLFLLNVRHWFDQPFSAHQIVSWILLTLALLLGLSGKYALWGGGSSGQPRRDAAIIPHAARLVTAGPYRFIRHPVYMALILFGWGAALKVASCSSVALAAITTGLLYYCSYREERENLEQFGTDYDRYMETTRMFIPGVF